MGDFVCLLAVNKTVKIIYVKVQNKIAMNPKWSNLKNGAKINLSTSKWFLCRGLSVEREIQKNCAQFCRFNFFFLASNLNWASSSPTHIDSRCAYQTMCCFLFLHSNRGLLWEMNHYQKKTHKTV